MKSVRVFVSSPGDTHFERVVERLNGEFQGIAKLEAVRWENAYYQARSTFQQQIPKASSCDIVIAILRHRLGTELPSDSPCATALRNRPSRQRLCRSACAQPSQASQRSGARAPAKISPSSRGEARLLRGGAQAFAPQQDA